MSATLKARKPKGVTAHEANRIEVQEPPRDIEQAVPTHVVGKPAEIEPAERAVVEYAEAPEAGMQSAEAPDAGYGRCTESSDWENRGRS